MTDDMTALAEAVGVLERDEPPITTRDIILGLTAIIVTYPLLVGLMLL